MVSLPGLRPDDAGRGLRLEDVAADLRGPAEAGDGGAESSIRLEDGFRDVGDVDLYVVEAGPVDGPPVVLLHGFPECWYGWRGQIRRLAAAGYRVVVPDQRGYNLSDKPAAVEDYRIGELADDVRGLVDALGHDSAHVVGHDWGAAVAWWTALHHPDCVDRLGVLNVPHPTVFWRHLTGDPRQMLKSWYVGLFQVPALPEALASAGDWSLLERTLRDTARPGTFSASELAQYRRAWRVPGAFTAMLNWYRAIARERPTPRTERVSVPTLVCWGMNDAALESSMARESVSFCDDGRLVRYDDASHWLLHEEPERVANDLLDFLGGEDQG